MLGTAPVVPFIPVLAKQLGYPASSIGFIYLILPIVGLVAKPLFGYIGDFLKIQKKLFILFQLVIIISFFGIIFIPPIPVKSELHCHDGVSLIKICPPNFENIVNCTIDKIVDERNNVTSDSTLKCEKNEAYNKICQYWKVPGLCEMTDERVAINTHVSPSKIEMLDKCFSIIFYNASINQHNTTLYCPKAMPKLTMQCEAKFSDEILSNALAGATEEQVKSTSQFWILFTLLIVSWAGMAVVVSVGDAICFELLGDKPNKFGYQRVWGSVGWGVLSIISGLMIDAFSTGRTSKNYAVGFYLMAVILFFDMIVSTRLNYTQTKHSSNILRDVFEILKSIRVIVFFFWCIIVGLGTAMIWNFLFWHLEDLAAAQTNCDSNSLTKTLQGLIMGIQCFGGEVPFFFFSGKILKKIGHISAMNLVLIGFALRFYLYSLLTNPWYVLPIELLNGITFGIFYATMTSYAKIISPNGTESTLQGLVGAVFEGIGVSCGSFIGGKLMESHGGSTTFKFFAISFLVFFLLHVAIQWLLTKMLGPYEYTNEYRPPYNSIVTSDAFLIDNNDSDERHFYS